jgi:hypothetical protein
LKSKAYDYERRNKSRTYLILNDEKTPEIAAYFTISLKSLAFKTDVSKTTIRQIYGFSKNVSSVALLLIGQFGKDRYKGAAVEGKTFLDICLAQVRAIHSLTGGRAVLLECMPIPAVIDFYERNGFKLLQTDEQDKYRQMVLLL